MDKVKKYRRKHVEMSLLIFIIIGDGIMKDS